MNKLAYYRNQIFRPGKYFVFSSSFVFDSAHALINKFIENKFSY